MVSEYKVNYTFFFGCPKSPLCTLLVLGDFFSNMGHRELICTVQLPARNFFFRNQTRPEINWSDLKWGHTRCVIWIIFKFHLDLFLSLLKIEQKEKKVESKIRTHKFRVSVQDLTDRATVSRCKHRFQTYYKPSIHAHEYSWLPSLDGINRIVTVTSIYLVRITGLACLQKIKSLPALQSWCKTSRTGSSGSSRWRYRATRPGTSMSRIGTAVCCLGTCSACKYT